MHHINYVHVIREPVPNIGQSLEHSLWHAFYLLNSIFLAIFIIAIEKDLESFKHYRGIHIPDSGNFVGPKISIKWCAREWNLRFHGCSLRFGLLLKGDCMNH